MRRTLTYLDGVVATGGDSKALNLFSRSYHFVTSKDLKDAMFCDSKKQAIEESESAQKRRVTIIIEDL